MKLILTISLILISFDLWAQLKFEAHRFKEGRSTAVNVAGIEEAYRPVIRYHEPSIPGGQTRAAALRQRKELVELWYPRRARGGSVPGRETAPVPVLIRSFAGNSGSIFPLDNHVAVSAAGQLVSVVNFNFSIFDREGEELSNRGLFDFTASLADFEFKYDPKVIYDSFADRFVMVMASGFSCRNSSLIVAFSQTNDATGSWNLYQIDGCPLEDGTWSDYPMISYTENKLILTANQIEDNGTWRENFARSLIWLVDKDSGYAADSLDVQLFSEIEYRGRAVRNICPVKNGLNTPSESIYLLSNRALDVKNDSIWILGLESTDTDSTATLKITAGRSDTPYGLPPNARQPAPVRLQTNDARILDAVLVDDRIQFVFTSIDTFSGNSAVYHGVINNLNSTRDISGQIFASDTEYAYPSIALAGASPEQSDVIIVASHASSTRNPGLSCLYVDRDGNASDWLTLKEGEGTVAGNGSAVRWGDYTGAQSLSTEGRVFIASSYGKSDNTFGTFLAELAPPGLSVGTTIPGTANRMVKSYPNPAQDRVRIQFHTPPIALQRIALYDNKGRLVKLFQEGSPKRTGLTEFSFSVETVPKGVYYVVISGDGRVLANERIVVN